MQKKLFASLLLIVAAAPLLAADSAPASAKQLFQKDLTSVNGKELILLTVDYLPGGTSMPHRHDAQVVVYVLEGTVTMQVKGQPAVTLHAGETFYESPTDVHSVSANASKSAPAKLLVFMVKDKGAPITRAAE
jgi:quercetin dioxygenase-like cupin family protein